MPIEEYETSDRGSGASGGAAVLEGKSAADLASSARAAEHQADDDIDIDALIAGEGDDAEVAGDDTQESAADETSEHGEAATQADDSDAADHAVASDDGWDAEAQALRAAGLGIAEGATRESVYSDLSKLYRGFTQLRQQNAQLQAMLAQSQQAPPQVTAQAQEQTAPKAPWEIAEWNPAMERFLRENEQGEIEVIPGGDPTLPAKYNAYVQSRLAAREKFERDPLGTLWDGGLQERVTALFEQQLEQRLSQLQQRHFAENAWNQDQQWIFQHDASGQPLLDVLGQPVPTDQGRAYGQAIAQLQAAGINDPQAMRAIALQMIGGHPQAQQQVNGSGKQQGLPARAADGTFTKQQPTKAQRDAEMLKKLQRQRGTRGAQPSGGTKRTNGRSGDPTTQGQRIQSVADHPAWEAAPDKFELDQMF